MTDQFIGNMVVNRYARRVWKGVQRSLAHRRGAVKAGTAVNRFKQRDA